MNYYKIERKAVYEAAKIFTEFGWIFREQPILDLGIDALVETPIDQNKKIKIFALQIKGGGKNFYRKKSSLTFYFSERHYLYWNALSETYPLFIVIQDTHADIIYWQYYTQGNIVKTSNNWKIDIPFLNVLNNTAKEQLLNIVTASSNQATSPKNSFLKHYAKAKKRQAELFFRYFLFNGKVFMGIEFCNEVRYIDLHYMPKRKNWDVKTSFLSWEDDYYYSLLDLELYLKEQFDSTRKSKSTLGKLMDEVITLREKGIEKIAEFIFDYYNCKNNLPKYSDFLKAFELHTNLKKGKYSSRAIGQVIHFKIKKDIFEMDTYEGATARLKNLIEDRSYDEIYIGTEEGIWSEIYSDTTIEKSKFIPRMLNEWEFYWEELYLTVKKQIGHTDHLDKNKEQSLRKLQSFFDLYDETSDIIELAYDLDEMVLYPIAVITMAHIFNKEVCFEEYCSLKFDNSDEWESICLDDQNYDEPIFFIRTYDL